MIPVNPATWLKKLLLILPVFAIWLSFGSILRNTAADLGVKLFWLKLLIGLLIAGYLIAVGFRTGKSRFFLFLLVLLAIAPGGFYYWSGKIGGADIGIMGLSMITTLIGPPLSSWYLLSNHKATGDPRRVKIFWVIILLISPWFWDMIFIGMRDKGWAAPYVLIVGNVLIAIAVSWYLLTKVKNVVAYLAVPAYFAIPLINYFYLQYLSHNPAVPEGYSSHSSYIQIPLLGLVALLVKLLQEPKPRSLVSVNPTERLS